MNNHPPADASGPRTKDYKPPAPEKRNYAPPVGWLLGRELLASLKLTILYTVFGNKLDARDWMHAQVYPSGKKDEALRHWRALAEEESPACGEAPPVNAPEDEAYWRDKGEFWFDYLSDTGDGMKATYSIAYLCLSNLWAEQAWTDLPPVARGREEADHRAVKMEPGRGYEAILPRGQFLLVGGDTTYHLADYANLANRFKQPFDWAFCDIRDHVNRRVAEDPTLRDRGLTLSPQRRPIFGIPGNHDYYDMLDGFRRQFRYPVRPEPADPLPPSPDDTTGPQLMVGGFRRCQESSYLALSLPFDWWLWALDTEVGEIDARQIKFFKELNGGNPPDKLIVATCAPTTVFGQRAKSDDPKSSKAFLQLGLPRVFLPEHGGPGGKYAMEEGEAPRRLGAGQIRLDLSGDVHQYARYWGPKVPESARDEANPTRKGRPGFGELVEHESHDNYASVVSGLGGAFHHPSTTYRNEVREAALYPPEQRSREAVADKIFNPKNVIRGGYVWLIGGLLAFLVYFFTTYVPSTRQFWAAVFSGAFGGFNMGWGLALISLVVIIFTLRKTGDLYAESARVCKDETKTQKEIAEENTKVCRRVNAWLWALTVVFAAVVASCLFTLRSIRGPGEDGITPYGQSVLVLLSMVWAVSGALLSSRHSDWLFEQASRREIKQSDWRITWVLGGGGLLSMASGLWLFGRNNEPVFLVADIIFTVVVVGVSVLLVWKVAMSTGGELHGTKGKAGMFFHGLWHAALQLFGVLLLVRKGTWPTLLLALVVVYAFIRLGRGLMKHHQRRWMIVAWVANGALVAALLPWLIFWLLKRWASPGLLSVLAWPYSAESRVLPDYASYEWWGSYVGWWALVPSLLAGLIGAFLCCVWFGWYLAVSLEYDGHNNEAGGAARIESFKQFIRFRVTEDDITGYVIAVDEPERQGKNLKPKLVDVFRLTRERGAG
jgi:hypothetical protein